MKIDIVKFAVKANNETVAAFPNQGALVTEEELRSDPSAMCLLESFSRALLEEAAKAIEEDEYSWLSDSDTFEAGTDSAASIIRALLNQPEQGKGNNGN